MGFLAPILLSLGIAVAVPLVLHLLQRQHGPRVVFPALRYLRRAEKENARRIKLRQILLLALRVSAVVLLALAAARPFVRWGGTQHEPTAAVIILDNSLSSGVVAGESRALDRLKARALEALSAAGPDDRFWLVRAATPWDAAQPGDAASTERRVRETQVAATGADLVASIDRAKALLAAGADGRATEIHLLTDLQASGFRGQLEADADDPPVIVWTPDDDVPANIGVLEVEVGGGLPPLANARSTVAATLGGGGEQDEDSLTVRLVLDGRIQSVATAPANATAVLPFPGRGAGLVHGWVETDPDALRADDRRYFVTRVLPPPTVALRDPTPFVDEALSVLEDAGRIQRVGAGAADVVLAPAADGLNALRTGRSVVVLAPRSALEMPAANRRLAQAGVPWRFEAPEGTGEARLSADEIRDPILGPLRDVRIRQSYRLDRLDGAGADSVVLRLSDGSPWAVRGQTADGGRYVVLASSLTEETGTLPTTPAMLPLLDRLVGAWTSPQPGQTEALPGERVPLPTRADAVERPDGERDEIPPGAPYTAPALPGIYTVLAEDREIAAFAVNPPAIESALSRLAPDELRAALPGWTVELTRDPGEWARSVYHRRLGREAWRPLILIALAVLLVEGLIATAGRLGTGTGIGGGAAGANRSGATGATPAARRPHAPAAGGMSAGAKGA